MKTLTIVLALAFTLLSGCSKDGRQYKVDLSDLIADADQIVITEHSSPLDSFDSEAGVSRQPDEIVYARVVLTSEQRKEFKFKIESLDPAMLEYATACAFVPHHRLDFFAKGKQIDSMEVCFECAAVKWNGSNARPPRSLVAGIAKFIESVGLQPDRNWRELIKQERK